MRAICLILALGVPSLPLPAADGGSVLPYRVVKRTLPNRLDVLVIETPEFKEVLNVGVMILAGSRNEVEPGRTGLAHLFEHMAFRHRFGDPAGSYNDLMEKMGAFDNGWTWFDVTYYHPVTFSRNLDEMVRIQADRFAAMDFSERIYRTEAGAVLGEYRKSDSDPSMRMEEVQCDLAYGKEHGYGHTTMGYLADVKDMPNSYASGRAFHETWYRPNNAVVIVSGDVDADAALSAVEGRFGAWKPADVPALPEPKPLGGPKRGHVDWEADIAPRISWAYRVPPFRPGETESAVLCLLPDLLAGKTAPLYQKIRYEKKTATDFGIAGQAAQGFDSRLLEATVRVEKDRYGLEGKKLLESIEADLGAGFEELKGFSRRPDGAGVLARARSKFRYDMIASLDSPAAIARVLAWHYRFGRDPAVLDRLAESVATIRPEDVDAFAARHFLPENLVVVTMAPKAPAAPEGGK